MTAQAQDRTSATGTAEEMLLHHEVAQFLTSYQRIVDEQRYLDWLELFTPDGVYSVIDALNAADHGMYLLYDDGLEARKERCGYLMGYWKVPRARTSHFVSNVSVLVDGDTTRADSKFLVYRTDRSGATTLHACGTYKDELVRDDGELKFQSHQVVIDMNLLPDDFTELL